VFYLAYHLHWSWTEIMSLPIAERHDYLRLLAGRIEADNKAVEVFSERWRRG